MEISAIDSSMHNFAEDLPYHQILEKFGTDLDSLPDYSPRFKEKLDFIRPALGDAKRFV